MRRCGACGLGSSSYRGGSITLHSISQTSAGKVLISIASLLFSLISKTSLYHWTNGLPGATKKLGSMMALRGLSLSQPRMRADTHDGPEQIAPLQRPDTLMQLSRSLILEFNLVPHG